MRFENHSSCIEDISTGIEMQLRSHNRTEPENSADPVDRFGKFSEQPCGRLASATHSGYGRIRHEVSMTALGAGLVFCLDYAAVRVA
jgi:hypothetical protein